MKTAKLLGTVAALSIITACSGGDSTGPDKFENVAGSYAGNTSGLAQGIRLNATFSVSMTQSSGSMSGIWGLQGVLDNGLNTAVVAGNGPVTGTISSGKNPSVTLTVKSSACPAYQATFTGSYDSATGRITVSGPIDFFGSGGCNVVLTYQSTVTLSRSTLL